MRCPLALAAFLALGSLPVSAAPVTDAPFQELKSYDFQNRKPVEAINAMIRGTGDAPTLAAIETRLIAVLNDPATTYAAQEEIGRMLREVGTARSVPALAKILGNEKLNNVARYALERIPDAAASKALQDALPTARGKALVGIITSIGNRGDAAAVGLLRPLATNPDADVASATIAALGKIGTPDAAAVLQALPAKNVQTYQALLTATDHAMAQQQNTSRVLGVYRQLMQDNRSPASIRLAATRSLLKADPTRAAPVLLQLLRGDDAAMRGLAARYVREMPLGSNTTALISTVDKLPTTGQVMLMSALADRNDPMLLPVLTHAIASPDTDIRLAALRSFATVSGTPEVVTLLAKTAAQTTNGAEREAARDSLASIRGRGLNEALMAAIPQSDPKVRSELVRTLGQRYVKSARPLLFQLTGDTDAGVQDATMNALGEVAGAEDYPTVVKLLLNTKSEGVRNAAVGLVLRLSPQVPTEGDRTSALIAGLNGAPVDTKVAVLKALGSIGGTNALNALRLALKDNDTPVQDAAVRALASAPDTDAMKDLLDIAKNDNSKVHQVLALRGYLRLADAKPAVELYEPVLKLATEAQEKKTIVSGLGKINSPAALASLTPMLDDESVRNESALAIVGIAHSIADKNPTEAKAALDKVITIVKDDTILKQATDAAKGIKAG